MIRTLSRIVGGLMLAQCAANITGAADKDEGELKKAVQARPEWLTKPKLGYLIGESTCSSGAAAARIANMLALADVIAKKCNQNLETRTLGNGQQINVSTRGTTVGQEGRYEEACTDKANGQVFKGIKVYLLYREENVLCGSNGQY